MMSDDTLQVTLDERQMKRRRIQVSRDRNETRKHSLFGFRRLVANDVAKPS